MSFQPIPAVVTVVTSRKTGKSVAVARRKLTWLDHAERHFAESCGWNNMKADWVLLDPVKESLMFMCLMADEGMLDWGVPE